MTESRDSQPGAVRAAAQAATQAAQDLATGALRVPVASAQIVAQLPDLIENLAVATARLNTSLDRLERYMALADPTLAAVDRLLPQLEAMAARGGQAFQVVRDIPGVGTLGRITGLAPNSAAGQPDSSKNAKAQKPRSGSRRRKD